MSKMRSILGRQQIAYGSQVTGGCKQLGVQAARGGNSRRGFNKRGAVGESILMMYRILLVTIIAFSVFAVVVVYYDFYVDSLNSEAIVLNRVIVNCLSEDGFDARDLVGNETELLSYCGIVDGGDSRIYAWVNVSGETYFGGDSGVRAISELYDSGSAPKRSYEPGSSLGVYDVYSVVLGRIVEMEVRTYVKSEEK